MSIYTQCEAAYVASKTWALLSGATRNQVLSDMARALRDHVGILLEANRADIDNAHVLGMAQGLIDRLTLTQERIFQLANSVDELVGLPDPLGRIVDGWTTPNGLRISQTRVPLGVVAMIYEARPNVTVDAVCLCFKTGNAVVLRGSASAQSSNKALVLVLRKVLESHGLDASGIQLLEDVTHEGVSELVSYRQFLSVVIPRGGSALIQRVVMDSKVPTIETGVGNCHIFVDASASLEEAVRIIENAKVQRPSVCNACETVLIHADIASQLLPVLCQRLHGLGVEMRGCEITLSHVPSISLAGASDWETEFLDLILAIKVVDSLEEAIDHIGRYGTHHSEAILSNDLHNVTRFEQAIDAAVVLVNTSTRFVDGGQFGFGAEIGISTQKLHVRGPVGLQGLTTYKYLVAGEGQVRG